MRIHRKICFIIIIVTSLLFAFSLTALAVTESEVQAQVSARGREAVAGNVFIWFLCAVAFLKVSQKIDSFMSSLGINVGHTGSSLMAEAMIAARGVSMGSNLFVHNRRDSRIKRCFGFFCRRAVVYSRQRIRSDPILRGGNRRRAHYGV